MKSGFKKMIEFSIITPLVAGVLAYLSKGKPKLSAAVAILGALSSFAIILFSAGQYLQDLVPLREFYSLLYLDSVSAVFALVTSAIAFFVLLYSLGYMEHEAQAGVVDRKRLGTYYALLSCFLAAMLSAILSANMLLAWAAIEATTLVSVFLISFFNRPKSIEAAWKYFIVCSVGITIGLIGIMVLGYGLAQAGAEVDFDWAHVFENAPLLDLTLLKIAFAFIIVGYGTKVGLVPLHIWLPDAHEQAPTPVSALLSGVLLNVAFYAVLRVHQIELQNADAAAFSSSLLVLFGLLSLGFAALRLYSQTNFKRLLAYSSVENMGVATLALGIGGPLGAFASLLHIVSHSLVKPLAFFIGGALSQIYQSREIEKIRGAAQASPIFGLLFIAACVGVAGSLPFGTFFSELALVAATLSQGELVVAGLAILFLSISFAVLLHKSSQMAFGEMPQGIKAHAAEQSISIAIIILFIFAIGLAFLPPLEFVLLLETAASAASGG